MKRWYLCIRLLSKYNRLLYNRPMIYLASKHHVIRKTDERRPAPHQTRPIHSHQSDRRSGWEEGKEDRYDQEAGRECIDGQTCPAQRPWSKVNALPFHTLEYHEHDGG